MLETHLKQEICCTYHFIHSVFKKVIWLVGSVKCCNLLCDTESCIL